MKMKTFQKSTKSGSEDLHTITLSQAELHRLVELIQSHPKPDLSQNVIKTQLINLLGYEPKNDIRQ